MLLNINKYKANKQDLNDVFNENEIEQKLEIDNIDRLYLIQKCSAKTGEGLHEGMEWIKNTLDIPKKDRKLSIENKKKSILLISAWIRKLNETCQLNIPTNISKLIHQFFQKNGTYDYKHYKFYGEF